MESITKYESKLIKLFWSKLAKLGISINKSYKRTADFK
jgi:hypothetical protein